MQMGYMILLSLIELQDIVRQPNWLKYVNWYLILLCLIELQDMVRDPNCLHLMHGGNLGECN